MVNDVNFVLPSLRSRVPSTAHRSEDQGSFDALAIVRFRGGLDTIVVGQFLHPDAPVVSL